jgi:hypothetical protein
MTRAGGHSRVLPPTAPPEERLDDVDAAPALVPRTATAPRAAKARSNPLFLSLTRVVVRPHVVLAASVLMAVALNLWVTRGQTFFSDEWHRLTFNTNDSLDPLLRGYSGNLVALHALLYKALLGLFGADSYLPFRITEALLVGTAGLLFFAFARSRAGPWPCLAATLVLLFLGSAFEVLATPFGIVFLLPVALGLAALICLQRLSRRWDLLACLLLVAAVAAQSVGLVFLAGSAVLLAQQSRRRFLARIWVVLVPALPYAAWFVWSRVTGFSSGSTLAIVTTSTNPANAMADPVHLHNLGQMPSDALAVCAAGLAAISGLFGTSGPGGAGVPFNLAVGYPLLGLLIVAAIWRVRSGSALAREVWVPVALALAFWALVGMIAPAERPPRTSRYIYPSAVFLLLILLELLRGIRLSPRQIRLSVAVLVLSLVPNLVNLVNQGNQLRDFATTERSKLGALELLREEVPANSIPYLTLNGGVLGIGGQGVRILAADYFAAVDRYGSPAASPAEIAIADESQRQVADQVLLDGSDLTLTALPAGRASRARDCRTVRGRSANRRFPVPGSGLEIQPRRSRSGVTVLAHRFATGFQRLSVPPGSGPLLLKPGSRQEVRRWIVGIGGATVCAMRSAAA